MTRVEKQTRKYDCRWCGNEFYSQVGYSSGGSQGDNSIPDTVTCPYCQNNSKVKDM